MRAWLEWAIARGEIKTEKDFSKNGAKQTFFFFFLTKKDPNVENYSVFRRGWGVAVTMTWDGERDEEQEGGLMFGRRCSQVCGRERGTLLLISETGRG